MPATSTGSDAVNAFLSTRPDDIGRLAVEAVALLRKLMPNAVETCEGGDIGFGVGGGYKGLVFTLTPETTHVTLSIANAAGLTDHTGLLEGKGKLHRHVKLEKSSDVQRPALHRLLAEALKRRK